MWASWHMLTLAFSLKCCFTYSFTELLAVDSCSPPYPYWLIYVFSVQRNFQNRRLSSRGQAMGHQEEPPGHELWQIESLYTPVLQEGHHQKAWRITQAGLPVCQPCMMKISQSEVNELRGNQRYAGHTVITSDMNSEARSLMFLFKCKDCLLKHALLPINLTLNS